MNLPICGYRHVICNLDPDIIQNVCQWQQMIFE